MSTLTITLVRQADGTIDESGSTQAFHSALTKFKAERETEQATIAAAVASVFDTHKGVKVNMPYLTSEACRALNAQPENYSVLKERTTEYVRSNAGEGKLFTIAKGPKGGVWRTADQPVAQPADATSSTETA